ncbi:hypothetical protein [Micromonospora sp. CPCC 206061]
MLRIARRRAADAVVRFCDGCAEVSTAAQRAERHLERARTQALVWALHH